jgi:hypothetical protein
MSEYNEEKFDRLVDEVQSGRLRNIQCSYGDVMTHDEFFELIDRS